MSCFRVETVCPSLVVALGEWLHFRTFLCNKVSGGSAERERSDRSSFCVSPSHFAKDSPLTKTLSVMIITINKSGDNYL